MAWQENDGMMIVIRNLFRHNHYKVRFGFRPYQDIYVLEILRLQNLICINLFKIIARLKIPEHKNMPCHENGCIMIYTSDPMHFCCRWPYEDINIDVIVYHILLRIRSLLQPGMMICGLEVLEVLILAVSHSIIFVIWVQLPVIIKDHVDS